MERPPRKANERAIDAPMWRGVIAIGLVMTLATLLTIDLYLPGGLIEGSQTLDQARTAGFTVLVLAQLFYCFNARSETTSAFRHMFTNRWVWATIPASSRGRQLRTVKRGVWESRTAARTVARLPCHGEQRPLVGRGP